MPDPSDPRPSPEGSGYDDEEMLELLKQQRDRALEQGLPFFGAIAGGDGPLIVVTSADQDILPPDT